MHTKVRVCMILLMSTVSFVPSRTSLGKTIHVLITQSTFQVHMHQCSWSHSAPLWTFLGNSWPICVPGLYLLWSLYQIIASLVKGVKCIHHPSLPTHAEVTMSDDISDFSRIDGGCLLGWMLCFSTCFLAALSINDFLGLLFFWLCASANTLTIPWALCSLPWYMFQWSCFQW